MSSLTITTSSEVDEDGVAHVVTVTELDGVEIGTATWSLTPDLACEFGWEKTPGAAGLSFFRGWEK